MTETKTKSFSETYWNLHRNTILLSSIFAFTNLPGVIISENQSISGIEFDSSGVVAARIFLALAATYAFVAYFLEWLEEAWVTRSKFQTNFSNRFEKLEANLEEHFQRSDQYKHSMINISEKLNHNIQQISYQLQVYQDESMKCINSNLTEEKIKIHSIVIRGVQNMIRSTLGFDSDKLSIIEKDNVTSAGYTITDEIIKSIEETYIERINYSINQISDNLIAVMADGKSIVGSLNQDFRTLEKCIGKNELEDLKLISTMQNLVMNLRSIGIGFAVPTFCFLFSAISFIILLFRN